MDQGAPGWPPRGSKFVADDRTVPSAELVDPAHGLPVNSQPIYLIAHEAQRDTQNGGCSKQRADAEPKTKFLQKIKHGRLRCIQHDARGCPMQSSSSFS